MLQERDLKKSKVMICRHHSFKNVKKLIECKINKVQNGFFIFSGEFLSCVTKLSCIKQTFYCCFIYLNQGWGTFSGVKATLTASTFQEGRKQQFCMCLFKSFIATIGGLAGGVVVSTRTPM